MKEESMELRRGAGGRPQLVRERPNAFTAAKQEIFFSTLAETCNVLAASRAAGIRATTVYKRRAKSAEFRARWAEAVREAYARLELMVLERAMNGTVKTITRPGGAVTTIHEYSNQLAMFLLRVHRDTAAAAEARHAPEAIDEVRDRLANRLGRLRRRIETEQAEGGKRFVVPEGGGLPS